MILRAKRPGPASALPAATFHPLPMIDAPPSPAAAWLPDPRYAARLAVRALIVWVGLRVAFVMLATLGMVELPLEPVAALALVAVVAAAVAIDARRREWIFAANLGTPSAWAPAVGAAVAGVLELGVALVGGG
jgi:hypothetical protein